MGNGIAHIEPADGQVEAVEQLTSFQDYVVTAIEAMGGVPRPVEIRTWIRENGPTPAIRMQADKPYFYCVLMRQAKNGRLVKVGEGYRLPARSAQAEAGGWSPQQTK